VDSERLYLRASAVYGVCWTLMVTVNLVFMVEIAGLDPLQMVLVGTVLEASVFVFEIPTGVVADAVSRRLSVIIGHYLTGAGFLLLALFPTFGMILLAQLVWGIGATFVSGAYAAWLTDEVGVARAGGVFLAAAQRRQLGGMLGIVASVTLAQVSLQLPIVIGACGILALAVALQLLMRETGFAPVPAAERSSWQVMGRTFRAGVHEFRIAPLLGVIFAITLLFGAFSEALDRLFTPFLLGRFELPTLGGLDPVVWWGVIALVSSLLGIVAVTLARRFVDATSHAALTTVLGVLTAAIGAAVMLLANVESFGAVLAWFWIASGLRVARAPLTTAWLNQHLPSHSRATLLSMMGQGDAIGQTLGGPIIGYVAKQVSIALALTGSAVALLPSLLLYRKAAALGVR
jgi:MFS transporter, DHA3 family, tetracycline resistance protein